jgi:transposase
LFYPERDAQSGANRELKSGKELYVMATMQQSDAAAARAPAPDPEVPERARNRTFGPRYKLDILNQYESLNKQGKGALLRREGLYTLLISGWRKQRDKGALEALSPPRAGRRWSRWSERTSACGGRTSACTGSWPRRAR